MVQVLEFVNVDNLEIPFIRHQRKDYWSGKLRKQDLWRIYDLDEKWDRIGHRR